MNKTYDVVIVGGGVTGLMTANKLTALGIEVALVEQHSSLASGPSTRNEGWLHRGTYHSVSINDHLEASQVARRCIYGHEQLRNFCPEAIEGSDVRPLAILRDAHRVNDVVERWRTAGVTYQQLTLEEATKAAPEVDFTQAAHYFAVNDVSINTRMLYRKLHTQAHRGGCVFYLGHRITGINDMTVSLSSSKGRSFRIDAKRIIYASGAGTRKFVKEHCDVDLPVRYWKSHLVVTKRLSQPGVFFLDAHEVAMMHHGDFSIVGFNEDAMLCEEPSYQVDEARSTNIHKGLRRLFPDSDFSELLDVACVKVDLAYDKNDQRSLGIQIKEIKPGHVIVLPGKLTESPFLTDKVASLISDQIDYQYISERPCDKFHKTLQSGGISPSKIRVSNAAIEEAIN